MLLNLGRKYKIYSIIDLVPSKQFSFFTNETLKKSFDQKLKEKYIDSSKDQSQNANNQANIFDKMKEAMEKSLQNMEEEGMTMILNIIKKKVFSRPTKDKY